MQLTERIEGLEARCFMMPFGRQIAIAFVAHALHTGKPSMAEPLVMRDVQEGCEFQPSVTLEIKAAQQLMDELWQCGLRPSEGSGSAGQLAAVQSHLKDMQKLVFYDKP